MSNVSAQNAISFGKTRKDSVMHKYFIQFIQHCALKCGPLKVDLVVSFTSAQQFRKTCTHFKICTRAPRFH